MSGMGAARVGPINPPSHEASRTMRPTRSPDFAFFVGRKSVQHFAIHKNFRSSASFVSRRTTYTGEQPCAFGNRGGHWRICVRT